MKNTSLFYLLWLLAVPLLWGGCDKSSLGFKEDPPELPPITTTGENTFGCRVNGAIWRNNVQFLTDGIGGEYHSGYELFQIHAKRWDNNGDLQSDIGFSAYFTQTGEHDLHNAGYWDADSLCIDVANAYEMLLESEVNKVNILNLGLQEFIVSGTFEFVLFHPECGDTIHVTDGRFDFDYAN